jgi:hypothetical protein
MLPKPFVERLVDDFFLRLPGPLRNPFITMVPTEWVEAKWLIYNGLRDYS